jgi:acetylglutamate kinase
MVAKLEEISQVAEAGVSAVHIINGNQRNALLSEIFGDRGSGTMVVGS